MNQAVFDMHGQGSSRFFTLLGVALAVWASLAAAPAVAADVRVVALQAPAWLEREGRRMPLPPGAVLQNRDRLLTGAGGRIRLALADDGSLALGEETQVVLRAMQRQGGDALLPEKSEAEKAPAEAPEALPFTLFVEVEQGVFTVDRPAVKAQAVSTPPERSLNIRLASLTVALRDGKAWGERQAAGVQVCRLAGKVAVWQPGQPAGAWLEEAAPCQTVAVTDPAPARKSRALAGKGERGEGASELDANAQGAVPPAILTRRAARTALVDGTGIQRQDGEWRLVIGPLTYPKSLKLLKYFADGGRLAQATTGTTTAPPASVSNKGKSARKAEAAAYQIVVGDFASEAEAKAVAARLAEVEPDLPAGGVEKPASQ